MVSRSQIKSGQIMILSHDGDEVINELEIQVRLSYGDPTSRNSPLATPLHMGNGGYSKIFSA